YYIHTPGHLTRKTTFIYKISPIDAERFKGRDDLDESDLTGHEDMARIHWHMNLISSSKLVYNGTTVDLDVFMPKKAFWKSSRAFTGPDGRTYVWHESLGACHVNLEDGNNPTVKVAEYKQRNIFKGEKPYLEIYPEGEHMADLIVITWLYYETRRRRRKQNAGAAASA
ncbi:hypothetical protein K474DRAFT_1578782, partial [Panus rudis PR-1116 ss-1]